VLAFRGDLGLSAGNWHSRQSWKPSTKKEQILAGVLGEQWTIFVTGEPVKIASQRGTQALPESLWKCSCFTFLNLICYIKFGTTLH
jgi:hypothetical protein